MALQDTHRYVNPEMARQPAFLDIAELLHLGRLTLHSIKEPESFFVKITFNGKETYGRHRRT